MTRSTWTWQLLCALGIVIGSSLNISQGADDKEEAPKGKTDPRVIVIQIDASKLPPDVLKQLMSLSQSPVKGGDKKPEPIKGEVNPKGKNEPTTIKGGDKKPEPKKGEENPKGKFVEKNPPIKSDIKKGEPKKGNILQVDLDLLSPALAKQLVAELARAKEGKKGEEKKGGDSKEEPKSGKKKVEEEDDNKKTEKKKVE